MRHRQTLPRLAVIAMIAVGVLASGPVVQADPAGTCTMGSSYTTGVTLTVNGAPQAPSIAGVYGDYTLAVCRSAGTGPGSTSTYGFSVGRNAAGAESDLLATDYDSSFVITFTPQAGDRPLTAEGKARITSFVVDAASANAVTLTARPIAFATINGCGTMPTQCVVDHPTANSFRAANLTGAIRYADAAGNGATGFSDLPGLATSSGAFMFFVWASCPTNATRDQSFSGLKIDLGSPHFQPDGALNVGSLVAYIPAAAVASCFGATPQAYALAAAVTRTEAGVTTAASTTVGADTGLHYVMTADDAGVTISFPDVTFSQPTYGMSTKGGRSLARTMKKSSVLARSLGVKTPRGGSLRVTIARSSKKVCVAGSTAVYGFGKGVCSYTVQALSAAGVVQKSKQGSFKVR